VEESLALIQTTSPNLLFYLSLEKAIWTMKSRGDEILGKAAYDAAQLRNLININSNKTGFQDIHKIAELCGFGVDPLKAAFYTNPAETGITGIELSEILSGDYGIIPEMSDFNSILFLLTGWETGENVKKLENTLNRILSGDIKDGLSGRIRQKPCDFSSQAKKSCYLPPVIAVTPRVAHFFPKTQAELKDCEGSICGVPVIPYPPGIPFLMPGEIIDREALSFLKNFISAGGMARGVENRETGIYLTILDE
jgi:arginine/lysine/ornithine decarboxylase